MVYEQYRQAKYKESLGKYDRWRAVGKEIVKFSIFIFSAITFGLHSFFNPFSVSIPVSF